MAGELRKLAKLSETATQQISEIGKASVAVAESAGTFLDRTAPDHRGFWRPCFPPEAARSARTKSTLSRKVETRPRLATVPSRVSGDGDDQLTGAVLRQRRSSRSKPTPPKANSVKLEGSGTAAWRKQTG